MSGGIDNILKCIAGDGTEDISCRMDSKTWLLSEAPSGPFSAAEAEGFYIGLREHFIGYLVYPAVFCENPNFPLKIGSVPPVVKSLLLAILSLIQSLRKILASSRKNMNFMGLNRN